mmetsp:Transcript_18390/g.69574  ORF Transcript_18390/g.69574 Transcript_18390/m.69574 type:complete len:137 (-) Transcript_18390:301-711(-)|eukprot:scaffold48_cov311-Pinguiococcus_pyrenoidosus.AAC.204
MKLIPAKLLLVGALFASTTQKASAGPKVAMTITTGIDIDTYLPNIIPDLKGNLSAYLPNTSEDEIAVMMKAKEPLTFDGITFNDTVFIEYYANSVYGKTFAGLAGIEVFTQFYPHVSIEKFLMKISEPDHHVQVVV